MLEVNWDVERGDKKVFMQPRSYDLAAREAGLASAAFTVGGGSCLPPSFLGRESEAFGRAIGCLEVKTEHNKQTKSPTNNVPHACMEVTFYIMRAGYLETLFYVYFSDIKIGCPNNQSICSHNKKGQEMA